MTCPPPRRAVSTAPIAVLIAVLMGLLMGLLSAALAGGVLLASSPAQARTAAPCRDRSLHQEIKRADVVFRGVVDKVRPVRGKGDQRTRTYKVTADRVYRSSLVTDSVRVTTELGARCPPPHLAKGKRYIFFVTEEGSRLVSTPATARASHKLTDQVVTKLGDGEQPRSTPPVNPEFTLVADAAPPRLSRLLAPGVALVLVSLLGLLVVGRVGRRPS
jgi:hypothetical protein